MRRHRSLAFFASMIVASVATSSLTGRVNAASITTLASFDYNTTGNALTSGVVVNGQGNLFGVVSEGPPGYYGAVYEVAAGSNTISPLAYFSGTNGANPANTPVLDAQGNLYGTTYQGGANGVGTVYEVAAGSNTITTLASFTAGAPYGTSGGVVVDAHGNLFGTTAIGGAYGFGTVFEIVAGSHTITTIASFDNTTTGQSPYGALALDSHGNLYGLAQAAVNGNLYGRVFEIAAGSNTITTLATFDSTNNNGGPTHGVVVDAHGNVYGTTLGQTSPASIYEIAAGSHTITTLANFDNATTGSYPYGGVILDSQGNLFGATAGGGAYYAGVVYELAAGSSTITPVAYFLGEPNGNQPLGGLALDAEGNLYGTTYYGGTTNGGTVYEVAGVAAAVPEPSAIILAAPALLVAAILARRRRNG